MYSTSIREQLIKDIYRLIVNDLERDLGVRRVRSGGLRVRDLWRLRRGGVRLRLRGDRLKLRLELRERE